MDLTLDLHAWWNAAEVAGLLRAVAGIVDSAGFRTLLLVFALFGLLAVTTAAVIRYRPLEIATWFVAVTLLYLIAFAPRATVLVSDSRVMSAQAVAGVPIGLALPAALSSQLGIRIASLLETALGDVSAARFTEFGAVFPERAAMAIAQAGPVSAEARTVLGPFVDRCVVPEVLESDARMAEVMASPNLVATVTAAGWVNPARFVTIEGAPVRCDAAAARMLEVLRTVEIPSQERLLMTRLSSDGSAVAEVAIRRAVPESTARMLGLSQTLSESLGHAVLLAEVPGGVTREAARSDAPLAQAVALARAQGALAAEISFRTMGELAAAFLPKLRNILEFILIAAFPIVMAMIVCAGAAGASVVRMYLTLFLWLALWAPIATVINHLLVTLDAHPMTQLIARYGGLTLEAADLIRDQGATSQAMAGYMMLLVPLVSYLIAKGSDMGAASLASSMMQPAAGAAQSQSAALSAGNVQTGSASIGVSSINSASGNKSDLSTGFVSGALSRTSSAWGTVTRDSSTGAVTGMTVTGSDLGVSAASTLTRGEASSVSATESVAASSSVSSGWTAATASSFASTESSNASTGVASSEASLSTRGTAFTQEEASVESASSASRTELRSGSTVGERFGLETRTGGSVRAGASETASAPMDGNLGSGILAMGTLGTGPASAIPAASFAAEPGAFPARTGAPGALGAPDARGAGVASAGLDASGRLSTGTWAANEDGAASVESAAAGLGWEARTGTESREALSSESRRTQSSSSGRSSAKTAVSSTESRAASGEDARRTTGSTHAAGTSRTEESRTGAGARLDSWLVGRAIAAYGSAEEALRALSNPAERSAFASEAMAAAAGGGLDPAPGRGVNPPDRAKVEAEAAGAIASTRTRAGAVHAEGARRADSVRSEGEAALRLASAAPEPGETPPAESAGPSRCEADLARGALIAARAAWRRREVGASGVLSTALLGGLAYCSPSELARGIRDRAAADPEAARALAEIAGGAAPDDAALSRLGLWR